MPDTGGIQTTETIAISFVESLAIILSSERITKAFIRLSESAGWPAPLSFSNKKK